MNTIIACIGDDSKNADSICEMTAWAAKQTSLSTSLLHVASPHYDANEIVSDLSGQIGLGSRSDLLEKLTAIDEEHGKLEQKKGQLLLDHAVEELKKKNITPEIIHRRGNLSQTVADLEHDAALFIMGKYSNTHPDSKHLGHNLESVSQTVHKPLLVVTRKAKAPKSFVIAFDGRFNSNKAINFIIESPLLKGLACHVVKVGDDDSENKSTLSQAQQKLEKAGFKVTAKIIEDNSVEDAITSYVADNKVDLIAMGAYGHSKLHSLFFGSTTIDILQKAEIPVLLFK